MLRTERMTSEQFRERETELCAFARGRGISGVWVILPSDPSQREAQDARSGSASPTGSSKNR